MLLTSIISMEITSRQMKKSQNGSLNQATAEQATLEKR